MSPEKTHKILQHKTDRIAKLAHTIDDSFDAGAIHRFRTLVKKLRTMLRLLDLNAPDSGPRLPGKFKELYHISGHIRDAQLAMETVITQGLPLPAYRQHLQHQLALHKKEWQRHYNKKLLHKLEERIVGITYHPLHPDVLKLFLNKKLDAIYAISEQVQPTDDTVHELRKALKDILYITAFTTKQWPKGMKHTEHLPIDQIDALAHSIGDYNDSRLQIEHMQAFAAQHDGADTAIINELYAQKAQQLKAEKIHILATTKALIASL